MGDPAWFDQVAAGSPPGEASGGLAPKGSELFRLGLAARLRSGSRADAYRDISRRTGFNHESVRRYMLGLSQPTAEFVAVFAKAYRLSPAWLLLEEGASSPEGTARLALEGASLEDLFAEIARRLSPLATPSPAQSKPAAAPKAKPIRGADHP